MEDSKQSTPYQKPIKFGLCIDWETSGATFGGDSSKDYQGLAFGAVVFDASTFSVIDKLYTEIKFDESKYKWTDAAQRIHGLTQENLAATGLSQEDAAIKLCEFILKYWDPTDKVMFLGHNPGFDIRFTNQLTKTLDIEFGVERENENSAGWIQLHHVVLDTSATGFITLGAYKSDLLFQKIGFPNRGNHNALQDALQTVETCAIIKALCSGNI